MPAGSRLKELQVLIRGLTYGEMIELVEGLWEQRPNRAEPVALSDLPGMLHRWATIRMQQGEPIEEPTDEAAVAAHNP